jgi:hypothetical protein
MLKLGVMQKRGTQVLRRLMRWGRLNPPRKETFYDGSEKLFLRAEPTEQRHLTQAGFYSDFAGCRSFETFTRKYPGRSIKKSL